MLKDHENTNDHTDENPNAASSGGQKARKRAYVSQGEVPRKSLEKALRIARAIADDYGKAPTSPLDVAAALKMTPTGGAFRDLAGAAMAYGLTEGGAWADEIALTPLGLRVVAPVEEGDDRAAMREALLRPRIVREFLQKYDGSKFPREDIGKNVLERMGVAAQRRAETLSLIRESIETLGLYRRIKDEIWVNLGAVPSAPSTEEAEESEDETGAPHVAEDSERSNNGAGASPVAPETPGSREARRPNALFIGARDKKPRDQLTKILGQYQVPYKVADGEPNQGRPISQKVTDTMEQCGAAILIFSADEEYFDKEGASLWRPADNVVHELGAASVKYGNRIVVFKEQSVKLATNFRDIGYIEFEKDKLDAKGHELLKELIAFGILKVSVGE